MHNISTTDICTYYQKSNRFLVVELIAQANITLEAVQLTYQKAHGIMDGKTYVVLLNTSGHNTWSIPLEVLKYMARNDYQVFQKAFAIVVNTLPMRIIANHFVSYYKPYIPTKVFTNHLKAEEWLLNHKI